MIIQFTCNFLLTIFLLYLFLKKINHSNFLDKNILGFGSKKETKTASGVVFLIILLINYTYYFFDQSLSELYPNKYYILLISIFILSSISLIDDLYSLDPIFRLACQLMIIYFSTTLIDIYYFKIPIKIIIFLYIIFWVYIINVTNFIDGSDGYLTVNAISFLLGIVIINQFIPNTYFSYWLAIVLLPILLAFIYFNKPKAKLYMGDTGSVLIGYIFGFCLLELITSKYWYLSIALYIYPVLDCSLVTLNKIYSGKSIFNRNFTYFFQLPIKKLKKNHYKVLSITIIYNLINLLIVFFILYTENKYLILLSIILSLIKIQIFRKI